jgi:hypothetical protein
MSFHSVTIAANTGADADVPDSRVMRPPRYTK